MSPLVMIDPRGFDAAQRGKKLVTQVSMSEELVGSIERITFQNEESGFTVAWLKAAKMREPICVVGSMLALQPGETIRAIGSYKNHLVYGRQFTVDSYTSEYPADVFGIQKYLGSGLVKGIGPKYAERIVERFGVETLRVIDQDPFLLQEVRGIGEKRIGKIKACWDEQKAIREVMIFLQGKGVSPAFAMRIFKTYQNDSIKKITENPYRLARDIFGIGFKSADKIAMAMGFLKDSPERIDAGVEFALLELGDEGHTCYPKEEFLLRAGEMLDVVPPKIEERLSVLKEEKKIILADKPDENLITSFVWIAGNFFFERGIAKELARIGQGSLLTRTIDAKKAVEWSESELKMSFAEHQKEALESVLQNKISIITGGPGTGKSTIQKALLAIYKKLTPKILLAAPTGKAAKRMTEITGFPAKTIHSMLEVDFKRGGFKRGPENPLDVDFLIIDEASMIDTELMCKLLRAVPASARAVFVGDIYQLPSVGAGNVLSDIIASGKVAVSKLTKIYRQAEGSKIVENAHRINEGLFPDIRTSSSSDFFFIDVKEPEEVAQQIVKLVTKRLPERYGFDPFLDIQVLAPMRRGACGTEQLNLLLADALIPRGEPLFRAGRRFKVGDKVMQIRNNYQKEVYNGDVGLIQAIDLSDQLVAVDFDGKLVEYEFAELDEIVLAYAVSIHKYQGSEAPCVIIPVHTTHFKMLHRNLIYTGVTRGKRLVILLGTTKALAIAVKNDEVKKRYTGLKEALLGRIV